jgi:polar amino acid transport system substrate-binding protein
MSDLKWGRSSMSMRFLRTLILCLFGAALVACQTISGVTERRSETRLQQILDRGEIRVGLSGNQPPLNMQTKQGEIVGLEVDLIEALADAMGLEVRLVLKPFAELLPALERNEVDLVISGMTITPARNARVAFAGPYLVSGKSVLSKSKEITNAESPAELDDARRSYAALASSTSQDFVERRLSQAKLVTTPDLDTAVRMVLDDEVDALIVDYPSCMFATLRHPEDGLSCLLPPLTIEPLGIALPADDPLFVNLVDNYLGTMADTALLARFRVKWFSDGSWISDLP